MQNDLLRDLRFAIRFFLGSPRFTVPAVLALALGIGATSAIFSIVRGVLLEPLPYNEPDRIVSIWETNTSRGVRRGIVAAANFLAWRERTRSFEHLGMVGPARLNILLNGEPFEITGRQISSEVFPALGVQPALGRAFRSEEDLDGSDAVIVISHEFWQTRLGGRTDVIGSTLNANGRIREVIGVTAPAFTIEGQKADFYIPYGWTIEALRAAQGRGMSHGIARLRPGVSAEQAAEEMRALMVQRAQEAPRLNTGRSVALVPIHEMTVETVQPALLVLSGAVALVLLIACVNVANLLLARSAARQRELGVRAALGASRARLLRQMLSESLLLSLAGGLAGLLVAVAFHRGLLALVADRIPVPRLDQVALDGQVVAFTMAVSFASGLLFGIVPALLAAGSTNDALREGGRHGASPRLRRALATLVVVEVALSLVLLSGAGLLLRSFIRLQNVDPGFREAGLLTARVTLPASRYTEGRHNTDFFRNALARIEAVPGVESAAGITFLPLAGPGSATSFYRLDRPRPADGELPTTEVRPVTPGFFRTMGVPHRAGRDFTAGDTADSPLVAIVSESLVRRQLPGEDPIGKRLHVSIARAAGIEVEIVGVVGDVKYSALDVDTPAAVYLPHPQWPLSLMTFVLRTGLDPASLVPGVAAAVRGLDPELPLADVKTMEQVVDATLARPRTVSALLAAFALIALVLAGVGVYGVMAYSVSQRTPEIGVRMALGATMGSVLRLVIGQALRLVTFGVVVGLAAAALLTQLLEGLLFNTAPLDPLTFAVTALVLTIVAVVASYVPARRGARLAPTEALRAE